MATIFTKIAQGEIPSYKIAENDDFFAFLDLFPLAKGHTLVIPKKEVDYIFDVEDELYKEYFLFAKRIAEAIKQVVPCTKVGMAVIGLEVLHAHIHLVPMNSIEDINFSKPKLQLSGEELQEIASKIAEKVKLQ